MADSTRVPPTLTSDMAVPPPRRKEGGRSGQLSAVSLQPSAVSQGIFCRKNAQDAQTTEGEKGLADR